MSGIRVDQNILNQKGTPAFNAGNFFDRPAAGFVGRIFISVNTYQIYRDEGTGWSLIADAGSGSGNLESVTYNGNNTPYGINITNGGLFLLGSTNGSIFFASGGSGQFTTDNANFFWDDTNNRLGIGTASPSAKLDIHSSSGTSATFNGTGSTNALLTFQSAGTSKWSVGNFVSSTVANDFNIYDNVNTVSRLQVHNTGVVNIPTSLIIGSTTPTSSYALDVTGTGRFTAALTGLSATFTNYIANTGSTNITAYLLNRGSSSFDGLIEWQDGGSSRWKFGTFGTGSGDLRFFSAATGGYPLTFNYGSGAATLSGSVQITGYAAPTTGAGLELFYLSDTASLFGYDRTNSVYKPMALGVNNQLNLPINGNVLIGTTTDIGAKLYVNGVVGISTYSSTVKLYTKSDTATSASYALGCENGSVNLFLVRGDGVILTGLAPNSPYNRTTVTLPNVLVDNDGSLYRSTSSSKRYKDNIENWNGNGLDTILKLKTSIFTYKESYYKHPKRVMLGLIAEDVAEVCSYLVDYINEDGTGAVENVRYATIVVPLIKAIQELNEKLIRNNIN